MKDEFWQSFAQTGSIADYIKYKEHEKQIKQKAEFKNANNNEGIDNQGTNGW